MRRGDGYTDARELFFLFRGLEGAGALPATESPATEAAMSSSGSRSAAMMEEASPLAASSLRSSKSDIIADRYRRLQACSGKISISSSGGSGGSSGSSGSSGICSSIVPGTSGRVACAVVAPASSYLRGPNEAAEFGLRQDHARPSQAKLGRELVVDELGTGNH